MARQIDRIVFWLLILAGLFVGFLALTREKIWLSAALSALGCLGLRQIIPRVRAWYERRSRRARREYARAVMNKWLIESPEALHETLNELLARRLPGFSGGETLILLPLSPASSAFTADPVLAHWREHRGEESITLVGFCRADSSARSWANKLEHPAVRLVDGDALEDILMREYPIVPEEFRRKEKRRRLSDALDRLLAERVSPVKAALYALLMLAAYLFSGRWIYLAAFGLLAAMGMMSAKRRII